MNEKEFIGNRQAFADRHGISRQTLNTYLTMYLNGEKDKIPKKDVAANIDLAYKSYYNVEENSELDAIEEEAKQVLQKIQRVDESIQNIHKENESLRFSKDDTDEEYHRKIEKRQENDDKEDELKLDLNDLTYHYDKLMSRRAAITQVPNMKRVSTKTNLTPTYAYFDDKKCMVIIDDAGFTTYGLYMYVKIKGSYVYLKEYVTQPDERVFVIDDIVLDAPLFYEVYGLGDREYELSGLCRLVPQNENGRGKR